MAKVWDDLSKHWLRKDPQAFVDLLLPGARLLEELPDKLERETSYVDILLKVALRQHLALLHIEFQTYPDSKMPRRLVGYNITADLKYDLPVLSVVFLLKGGGRTIKPPPLERYLPGDEQDPLWSWRFNYIVIDVGQWTPQALLATGHPILLVLLPLSKGGANPETVEMMDRALQQAGEEELRLVGRLFAGLVFRDLPVEQQEWIKKRFAMMKNIWEDSIIYQEILRIGKEQGIEREREEGLKKGRETLMEIVRLRFPSLLALAHEQTTAITESRSVQRLIVEMAVIRDEEAARQVLLSWQGDADDSKSS